MSDIFDNYEPPRKGDKLFSSAYQDWHNNACVGWNPSDWSGYAEGYKRAADKLIEHVTDTQSEQDFLVYPITFLYRHAFEILMKDILMQGSKLVDTPIANRNHHRLTQLWSECKIILKMAFPDQSENELDAIEEIMKELDQKDPKATAFRYPVDTTNNESIPTYENINLRNLFEVAHRTYEFLSACSVTVSETLQQKLEFEANFM